jgi:hypothetical protein
MLAVLSKKLVRGGALRILTDLDGAPLKELIELAGQAGMQQAANKGKEYFPQGWRDPEFRPDRKPQIVMLVPK